MALIGMEYPVFAPIATEVEGSAVTYSAGFVLGKAVEGTLELTHNDARLYANNVLVESDNTANGGSVGLTLDHLRVDVLENAMNFKKTGTTYTATDAAAPYGGFGFISNAMVDGVKKCIGFWVYKTCFALGSLGFSTKGQSTSFSTQSMNGALMGVYQDSTGNADFYDVQEFTSESAARTWLNGKAGIT